MVDSSLCGVVRYLALRVSPNGALYARLKYPAREGTSDFKSFLEEAKGEIALRALRGVKRKLQGRRGSSRLEGLLHFKGLKDLDGLKRRPKEKT